MIKEDQAGGERKRGMTSAGGEEEGKWVGGEDVEKVLLQGQ